MPKISDCDRCEYFLNSAYLICAVNPSGPASDTCEDFAMGSETQPPLERQPLGGGYYLGDWIPQPFPAVGRKEQRALLDWHPQFTGRCPACEAPIPTTEEQLWRCSYCDWKASLV